ncbi:chemotaxis protein CheW [Stieleria sp. JC731]|uniref:chemotaxis protein CheA n=1 Tax=Pirellulaceae TaxID=2691357 RepID=UPI001E5E73E3|nr:chemotaxis protein CheA [Stieleria sp. JC731]MCC9600499.1 chemotaxis protein CheW [Stieleria sp. JC731]
MDGFDEIINEFLVESYESLDRLDDDLLALEDAPDDRERLGSIFRTVHTIKGTSGFLALPTLERVAHVGENLLVPLRDGELQLTSDIASVLLEMVDAIREILGVIESGDGEGSNDYAALVERLQAALSAGQGGAAAAPEAESAEPEAQSDSEAVAETEVTAEAETATEPEAEAPEAADESQPDDAAEEPVAAEADSVDTDSAEPDTTTEPASEPTATQEPTAEKPEPAAPPATPSAPAAAAAAKPAPPEAKPAAAKPPRRGGAGDSSKSGESSEKGSVVDSTVRIDVALLDKLMNLVGELVLARNQIMQFSGTTEDPAMAAASQRLNLITTELQEGVMKTRMQPIRNAWNKLPRVVRDLSTSCGKKVSVVMEGADTELDKTILEAIKDPLTHIVRNSVDHGIESPEVREAAGKPSEGTLCLRAFHEGGQVNIEIVDDGGGINADRVREKALEKDLITPEQAETMGERELTNLILLPGFSTAPKVTNVSGRGVGMDVVKTNIERIGGTLEIQSEAGAGTTLRIKIPLTLAIVPALIIKSGGGQYAIPQVSLLELVRLDGARARKDIEYIHDVPVYRLREHLLPLVYLDEQLGLRPLGEHRLDEEAVNIVVLQAEDRQFGLVVDAITDTQEIVVKPLGAHLKNISAYAGATIMGDGTVSLILDVLGIAHKSCVLTEHRDRSLREHAHRGMSRAQDGESVLIIDSGDGTRAAIRLSSVARLEEFAVNDLERSGHNYVVQYRGQILPLISLNSQFGDVGSGGDNQARLHTVVYSHEGQSVGIVVGKIVDIVHQQLSDADDIAAGRSVIQDRVTQIVNLQEVVSQGVGMSSHW